MSEMEHLELARWKRDRRLRRRLLRILHHARAGEYGGWVSGRFLADLAETGCARDQGFESDEHALALLRDLVNKGLAEERQEMRRRGQRFSLEVVSYKIAAKGSSLLLETIPADPDIDDERSAG